MTPPDEPLFPGYEPPPPPPSKAPALSDGQRRTLRQRETIKAGRHPLNNYALHPAADPDAHPDDGPRQPYRCGTCTHRISTGAGNKTFAKCAAQDGRWITHSEATDVRAWWPGCTLYEPHQPDPAAPGTGAPR